MYRTRTVKEKAMQKQMERIFFNRNVLHTLGSIYSRWYDEAGFESIGQHHDAIVYTMPMVKVTHLDEDFGSQTIFVYFTVDGFEGFIQFRMKDDQIKHKIQMTEVK